MSELQHLRNRVEELELILGMGQDDVSLIRQVTGLTPMPATLVSILYRRRVILTTDQGDAASGDVWRNGRMRSAAGQGARLAHSSGAQGAAALRRQYLHGLRLVCGGGGFSMDELSRARFKAALTQRLKGMLERLEPQPREIA